MRHQFKEIKICTVKKLLDEIAVNQPIEDSKSCLRVFNAYPDIILVRLQNRCEVLKNFYSKFLILSPKTFLKAQKIAIINKAEK